MSGATVRRDLQALSRSQLLVRTHGGAVSQRSDAEVPAGVKAVLRQPEKRRIARAADGLVGEGAVVGLTGGSTTLELARVLLDRRGLTVVTNSLDVASELAGKPGIRLVMIGGIVRRSRELVGPAAETMLANYHLDLAFIGVDGLSAEGCTTYDEMEADDRRGLPPAGPPPARRRRQLQDRQGHLRPDQPALRHHRPDHRPRRPARSPRPDPPGRRPRGLRLSRPCARPRTLPELVEGRAEPSPRTAPAPSSRRKRSTPAQVPAPDPELDGVQRCLAVSALRGAEAEGGRAGGAAGVGVRAQ